MFPCTVKSDRSEEARREPRQRFADLFEARAPTLGKGEAMRVTEVALMIAKGLPDWYARVIAQRSGNASGFRPRWKQR